MNRCSMIYTHLNGDITVEECSEYETLSLWAPVEFVFLIRNRDGSIDKFEIIGTDGGLVEFVYGAGHDSVD